MVNGIGKVSISEVQQGKVNSGATSIAGSGETGSISSQRDSKESATNPQFGEVFKKLQANYGEKAAKPREIKKSLGKDDFLKIMVTQMKNQDPTNPFKAEQMASEIAQFTSVEQLQNVNQNLSKMSTQNRPVEHMAMTNLIGKKVTIDRERFPHMEGETESLSFQLPKDAAKVQITIVSENGEVLLQKDLEKQKAGDVSFNWDGVKSNSVPAKTGNYLFRIDAKDEHGKVIETNPRLQARVIGVSFEGTEPVFLVGDAKHQDKVMMRNIVRIEIDGNENPSSEKPLAKSAGNSPDSTPGVQKEKPTAPLTSQAPQLKPGFFEFKRGIGSITPPSSQSQAGSPQMAAMQQQGPSEEKGFPNGLHDLDSSSGRSAP